MRSRRGLFLLAALLSVLFASGCSILSSQPSPTAIAEKTATPAVNKTPLPAGTASVPAAPTDGATPTSLPSPTATRPAPATPKLPPSGFALYINPDQLWSLRYPANRLASTIQNDGSIRFRDPSGAILATVDTYVAKGNEYGNTGEGLRNRARDEAERILGKPVKTTNVLSLDGPAWETGIAFTTDDGMVGEAAYGQRGRQENDFRVYGLLQAYKAGTDRVVVQQLKTMRDSFLPVFVQSLGQGTGAASLWLVSSRGMRSYETDLDEAHFVAVYDKEGGWREIAHADLANADYVDAQGVRQVQVEPGHLWLTAESGVGAHGGCFELFSFDGQALASQVAYCHDSPGAGRLEDVDGDGTNDAVLDATENYVFCYACGVRFVRYRVMRWNGSRMVEVNLTKLPDSAPATLRQMTNHAVDLAKAELWQEAQSTIDLVTSSDPIVTWDAALIHLHARGRAEQAHSGGYPLLDDLFNGDYPAVLAVMRPYPPAQLFSPASPLVAGTAARGFESSLTEWVTRTTTLNLQASPNLAAAYFVRGWGIYQGSPGTAKAQADIERAAQLDPNESLYSASAAFMRGAVLPAPAARERVQFGAGSTSATLTVQLSAGIPKGYVLRALGQRKVTVFATNKAAVVLLDSQDNRTNSQNEQPGKWEGTLPKTGDYTLVLFGQGAVTVTINILAR